jgi:hypothetical protein
MKVPHTFLSTAHICKTAKAKIKDREKRQRLVPASHYLVFSKSYKKTGEKGQGSEALTVCLKRVREEYLRELGTLVMVDKLDYSKQNTQISQKRKKRLNI